MNRISQRSLVGSKDEDELNIEPVGPELDARVVIEVSHLSREFESGEGPIRAVDDLSVSIYQGQIFALLGHNGAGKTTLIHTLTGMLPPSSGDASIFGQSILTDMDSIRDSMGVCPQHNILFPLLSVTEHLRLFGRIKGAGGTQLQQEIDSLIQEVGLEEKRHAKAGVLSGGQKRKLSVAIALIAGSRVVFLDEPTSGMDPFSRRSTWDLLRRAKRERVIILTTHFMEEADQLGDRVAIMARGDIKCCGSSLFLKTRFGVGYTLTFTKSGDGESIKQTVMSAVPSAELFSDVAAEISFRLPFDAAPSFPDLFARLDSSLEQLSISSYGISVTTLEEVFLRVGRGDDAERKPRNHPRSKIHILAPQGEEKAQTSFEDNEQSDKKVLEIKEGKLESETTKEPLQNTDSFHTRYSTAGRFRQFQALLAKRFQIAKRDRRVLLWQLFYPFLVLITGIGLLQLGLLHSFPPMLISDSTYNRPHPVMYLQNEQVTANAPLGSSFTLGQVGSGNSYSVPYPFNLTDSDSLNSLDRDLMALNFSIALLNDYRHPRFKESRYVALCWEYFEPANSSNDWHPRTDIRLFYNSTGSASLPVGLNLYHNMIYQQYTQDNPTAKITLTMHPFPRTGEEEAVINVVSAFLIIIALSFIPASFISQIVKEREMKMKHQLFLSGVDVSAYWAANYSWDFISYLLTASLTLIVIAIYQVNQLLGESAGATVLTLILYGFSASTFIYAFSFLFSSHSSAQNYTLLLFIFTGPLLVIVALVLEIIPSASSTNEQMKFVYRLLPHFCLGESLVRLIIRDASSINGGSVQDIWDMDVVGWPCLFMFLDGIGYFLLVQLIEKVIRTPAWLTKLSIDPRAPPSQEVNDPDVVAERSRILQEQRPAQDQDVIELRGLRKVYRSRVGGEPIVAVDDLWFGVPKGQCFGFLGINGAGKTTAMQILTGDVIPSSGTALLNGIDVLSNQHSVRRLIGYCPQFDALFDLLTGREHLALYSRIKGVPEKEIPQSVESMIDRLDLAEYADRPSREYSGGNKRKLSVGIALIGNPPIVFLDEPSTGMDPKARRFLWDLISSSMAGRSVILTTHSMEECEALCGRIGIMVQGRLRCIGTAQHLKHRYGDAYQIELSSGTNPVQEAVRCVCENFPGSSVIEEHPHTAKMRIPKLDGAGGRTSLCNLFTFLELRRHSLNVTEYSVGETTLEQIFVELAQERAAAADQ